MYLKSDIVLNPSPFMDSEEDIIIVEEAEEDYIIDGLDHSCNSILHSDETSESVFDPNKQITFDTPYDDYTMEFGDNTRIKLNH